MTTFFRDSQCEPKKYVHTAQNYNKSMENNGEKLASLEVR